MFRNIRVRILEPGGESQSGSRNIFVLHVHFSLEGEIVLEVGGNVEIKEPINSTSGGGRSNVEIREPGNSTSGEGRSRSSCGS